MKVVGYCRVSTQEQAVNGTSIETQKLHIQNECKKLGYQLIEIYIDGGVSGNDGNRFALNRLLEDAKFKTFNCVMFTKPDRLSRNLGYSINVVKSLEQLQVKIHCIEQPIINKPGLMFNILGSFAEHERDMIKERTDSGRKAKWKSESSVIGSLPFGYKKVNGKVEIDDLNSLIYNRIVNMYLNQNYSMKDIAVKLTAEGIPLPGASNNKHSNSWSSTTISDILKNDSYTGITYQNKYVFESRKSKKTNKSYYAATNVEKDKSEWIKRTYPKLIDQDRFDKIQKRISLQKKKPKKQHSGLNEHFMADNTLYCGYCGTRLRKLKTNEGKLKYTCHWAYTTKTDLFLSNRNKCILKPIDAKEADDRIFDEITEIISDPGHFAQEWLRDTNIDELSDKVNRLNKIENNLRNALLDGFRLVQESDNPEIKQIYKDALRNKEQEFSEVQNSLKNANNELFFAVNKVNHLAEFQSALEDAAKRDKIGIYFSAKAQFKTFLCNLPFQEKKRIVGAVVSPEDGGKYLVRHPTLNDIADDTDSIPEDELYTSLPAKGHILDGIFSIDLNRIQSIISSLNYMELLSSAVPG
ncbi:Resolvase, N-terminal domain protein [Pelobacter propionicus DSM 2379]|uniref:Resolvase, N-terminal domain protein n=2 Tax=Pelobacter propionicus TaxID=29543 RepID=A1AKN9_PELPD|nr:Resolvase, N-terminal domain protein [Pelobacter propionicus DSM 2379]